MERKDRALPDTAAPLSGGRPAGEKEIRRREPAQLGSRRPEGFAECAVSVENIL